MKKIEQLLKKHGINFHQFKDTMRRVAVTAVENNLEHDFDAAFKLMLEKDLEFINRFTSDVDFKKDVTDKMAGMLHVKLNA